MSWRKRICTFWILLSNGTILFFAVRLLLAYGAETASEARVDRILGTVFGLWCLVGVTTEALHHRWARRINITLPISIAVFMVSTVAWLPAVSTDGDRFDAALGFAFFAIMPACLALLNYLAYRQARVMDSEYGQPISDI
jgi:uncharacterized membrane protein